MAIFRGVGGSGDSSDNSFLDAVTAQANSASASATSAANSLAAIQQTEVTSASFDTSDGVLTLTKTGGATVTADLDGRFLTSYTETNDLSTAVTWANVPDANITQTSVTQHQAALTITESQISDLQSYLTSYTETNDLSTAVTWANVPDANITQSSVTQHQAALSITESQISDLQTYLTAEANDLSTTVTWANVPDANITQSSVTQHQAALSITESQISDLQSYLTSFDITTQTDPKYLRADADDTTTGTITADGGFSTSTGNFVTLSGSITTNSGNISANSGNISTSGNIIVGGTVDGRNVSTDGSKLDTLLYHRVSELRLAGNTSAGNYLYLYTSDQNLGQATNIYHPATPDDTTRLVDVEWTTYWGYTSVQNDTRLTLQLIVPVGATTQNLGTVTEVSQYDPNYSSRGSGQKWYYVSGDVAHHFTPFGRMSQSSSGSLKHTIVSSQYDPNTNRTYFCLKISTANMVTGDTAYWHPYAWESTYTILTQSYDITERYRSGLDRNKVSFKLPFTDTTLTFRLKIKELASGDNAQVADSVVRLTSMGV